MGLVGRNQAGNLYGLTALCPIKIGTSNDRSHESHTRQALADFKLNDQSPLAAVPNTYLARFHILKDVFYEGKPGPEEHLKSQYLIFTSNFHGALETYLHGMWEHMQVDIALIWQHCVGFGNVNNAASFTKYIKKCQVTNALLFNGSNDLPLAEQLKSLYLKQEFSKFVIENQPIGGQPQDPAQLKQAFREFVARVELDNLARPTWKPGGATLESVVIP